MNRKIVTLLKMVILSLGLIAVVAVVSKEASHNSGAGKNLSSTSYDFAMGTSISINVYSTSKDFNQEELKEKIIQEIKLLDEKVLSWRSDESELGRLNKNYNISQENILSTELATVLIQSLAICRDSEGALDITIRPLATLWNIEGDSGEDFVPPNRQDINSTLERVDYQSIEIISETYSTSQASEGATSSLGNTNYYAVISSEDIVIDLGATGKGYALDKAKTILQESEVGGALVTVGGSILVYGEKSTGEPWRIGVRDPLKPNDTNAMMGYIELPAGTVTCVSTSGGYEKYKTYEGKDYHHILDSKTGYPADSGLLSVTVVCENGLVSDGLSTACFVLGYEKSLALLEKYNAEAVFMDSENNIIVTDGLKDYWVED